MSQPSRQPPTQAVRRPLAVLALAVVASLLWPAGMAAAGSAPASSSWSSTARPDSSSWS